MLPSHPRQTFILSLALILGIAGVKPSLATLTPDFPGIVMTANTELYDEHWDADVAYSEDGTHLVCWNQGFPAVIKARLFDTLGDPLGLEFQVDSGTGPKVAADSLGNFVIVWVGDDGGGNGIFGRRYDRTGAALGATFPVNTAITGSQGHPVVDASPTGSFVVAWDSGLFGGGFEGIVARMYDAGGSPTTGEILVRDSGGSLPVLNPDVALFGNGGFVVTWEDSDGPGSGTIKARRYDASGTPEDPEFGVGDPNAINPWVPAVFANTDGTFGIVWEERDAGFTTSFIKAQLFDATGAADGGIIDVYDNPCSNGGEFNVEIDADADGNFIVFWQSLCPDRLLHYRHYLPNGTPTGPDTNVAAPEDGPIALDVRQDGGHILAWHEYGVGVHFQRFDTDCDANLVADLVDIDLFALDDLNFNGTPDDCEPAYLPPLVVVAPVAPIGQNTGPIPLTAMFSRTRGFPLDLTVWEKVSGPGRVLFSDYESVNTEVTLDNAGTYVLRYVVATSVGEGTGEVTIVIPPAVSTFGLTPPASPVEFLSRPRLDDAAIAADYYNAIDPFNEATDFEAWKLHNGFPDSIPTVAVAQGSDCCTGSAFFNSGDLGFGRRMIMKKTGDFNGQRFYAFSVTNYATIEEAIDDVNPVATVSMEYSAIAPSIGPAVTKFYIFQDLDQDGIQERVPSVDLDGNGPKYLPALCIACHGGENQPDTYRVTGRTGAYFLPYDMDAFEYSTRPGFRREDQEDAFKEFNVGVLGTNPASAIRDLITGWYGGFALPLNTQNNDYIPTGWTCTPTNSSEFSKADLEGLYRDVIRPSCRVCHSSRKENLDFMNAQDFIDYNSNSPTSFSLIEYDAFTTGSMPNAKVTHENFWNSTLPYQPDILKNAANHLNQGLDCVSAVDDDNPAASPLVTRISSVHPNPFNPRTTIRFDLHRAGAVRLRIYDVQGRLVRNLDQDGLKAGSHEIVWRGANGSGQSLASGSYFVKLETEAVTSTKRVTLLK